MTTQRVVPVLTVPDIVAARAVYETVLGMRPVMDHGWILTLADDEGRHQISLMTKDRTAPVNPQLSVEVVDVDAACLAAQSAGVEIVHPLRDEDWGVRRFLFRDAAGTVVNVLSHR